MTTLWSCNFGALDESIALLTLSLSVVVPDNERPRGYGFRVALERRVEGGLRPEVAPREFELTLEGYEQARQHCRVLCRDHGGVTSSGAPKWGAIALVGCETSLSRAERHRIVAMLEGTSPADVPVAPASEDYATLVGGGHRAGAFAFDVSLARHRPGR